jgi:hypothetical protein
MLTPDGIAVPGIAAEALLSFAADPEAFALLDFPLLVAFVLPDALPELLVLALAPCCDADTEVCEEAPPEVCVLAVVCATAVARSKLDTNKPETTDFMLIPPERYIIS